MYTRNNRISDQKTKSENIYGEFGKTVPNREANFSVSFIM